MKRLFYILMLAMLLIPLVSADVIFINPLAFYIIPFIPLILLIEVVTFWFLNKKFFEIEISFRKILLIVIVANLLSALVGYFIPLPTYGATFVFLITLIFSIVIEYPMYLLFFIKKNVSKLDLFWLCSIANVFGYLVISIMMLFLELM